MTSIISACRENFYCQGSRPRQAASLFKADSNSALLFDFLGCPLMIYRPDQRNRLNAHTVPFNAILTAAPTNTIIREDGSVGPCPDNRTGRRARSGERRLLKYVRVHLGDPAKSRIYVVESYEIFLACHGRKDWSRTSGPIYRGCPRHRKSTACALNEP